MTSSVLTVASLKSSYCCLEQAAVYQADFKRLFLLICSSLCLLFQREEKLI